MGKFDLRPISADLAFEKYRLEIAEQRPDSPAKDKTIAAIQSRMESIRQGR
jgi:hypothetical protein